MSSTADQPGARSDSMTIAHVPADRSRAVVISLPRDLRVDLPSCRRRDPRAGSCTGERLEPREQKVQELFDALRQDVPLDPGTGNRSRRPRGPRSTSLRTVINHTRSGNYRSNHVDPGRPVWDTSRAGTVHSRFTAVHPSDSTAQ
ncbi:hypothetical protein GCM10027174_41120 [Salinifilum aidingensis]